MAAAMVLALTACGRGFETTATASAALTAQRHANNYRFWIGEVGPSDGPLHLGPKQYPFICHTYESGLGQPLVDNQDGRGHAVFPEAAGEPDFSASPVGYSERCGIATRVDSFYWDASAQDFRRFDPSAMFDAPPSAIQWIVVNGRQVPFIVRVETGTLDRFLYTIAMLAPWRESTTRPDDLDNGAWNRKLIYYFGGGVGIGHQQGRASWLGGLWRTERAVFPRLLSQGYAIATSSGNQTGTQYNLRLAEEVTLMVKRHFVATYGKPAYTVGLGESGGGVQQYTIAQNHPGLLDAGIPMYSYPDMVTQAIYAGDCNLLEQYFLEDVQAKGASSKWAVWSRRQWIEGLNASDTVTSSVFRTKGSSECVEGWFFAEPLVLNPRFTDPWYLEALKRYRFPADAVAAIRWTHFNDLQNIYGFDAEGYAPILFDNVGVQYGLAAHALALLDAWLTTGERPAGFVDQCTDASGNLIAAGRHVWTASSTSGRQGPARRRIPSRRARGSWRATASQATCSSAHSGRSPARSRTGRTARSRSRLRRSRSSSASSRTASATIRSPIEEDRRGGIGPGPMKPATMTAQSGPAEARRHVCGNSSLARLAHHLPLQPPVTESPV